MANKKVKLLDPSEYKHDPVIFDAMKSFAELRGTAPAEDEAPAPPKKSPAKKERGKLFPDD